MKTSIIRCPFCGTWKQISGSPECSCGRMVYEPGDEFATPESTGEVKRVDWIDRNLEGHVARLALAVKEADEATRGENEAEFLGALEYRLRIIAARLRDERERLKYHDYANCPSCRAARDGVRPDASVDHAVTYADDWSTWGGDDTGAEIHDQLGG